MARKVVVEVEVPEGVNEVEFLREARRQLARLALLYTLESLQRRAPSQEEIQELIQKVKKPYKAIK